MPERLYMIVVGAGKVGWNLTRELLEKGHEVTLIENDRERYSTVEQELEHNIQYGDASELWVLERSGIQRADLVITDLHMPNKDGIQTILELLTHTPGVPIIAMSGGGQTKRLDLLGNVTLLGTVLTIEKPFTLSEMMAAVSQALQQGH